MADFKLQISFLRSDDKSFTMSIPDVKTDLTSEQAMTCANAILALGIITPGGATLTKLMDVKKIEETVSDFYDPPKV